MWTVGIQVFGNTWLRIFQFDNESPNITMLAQQIYSALVALQRGEETRNHLMPNRNDASTSRKRRFCHLLKDHL